MKTSPSDPPMHRALKYVKYLPRVLPVVGDLCDLVMGGSEVVVKLSSQRDKALCKTARWAVNLIGEVAVLLHLGNPFVRSMS